VRSPSEAALSAWLRSDIPSSISAGSGDVLALDGYFEASRDVASMEVTAGAVRVPTFIHGVSPPGEVVGSDWWSALVPIPEVAGESEVGIAIHARLANGLEADVELGSALVLPRPERSERREADREQVCVCMATYDPDPELFRAQVESIRGQDHSDWICLISDDASPRAALDAMARTLNGDERFVLIRNERRAGFYRNFERALLEVPPEARYVALADQDDRWHHDKLSSLILGLRPGSVLVHSDARIVDARGEERAPTFWPRGAPGSDRLEDLVLANTVSGASCLFERSLLDDVLPFPALPGQAYHDRWIALGAAATGRIDRVERPLYDYVQHSGSVLGHRLAAGAGEFRPLARAKRLSKLRSERPNWREAHDSVLARSVAEAIVLRLRFGRSMPAADRQAVNSIEHLPDSPSSALGLARRYVLRAPRRAPGLEGALVRALAWRVIAKRRGQRSRTQARAGPVATRRSAPSRRAGSPARIGITVTDASAQAGFGDLYTARELASALSELGHEVTLLELHEDRWRDFVAEIDVLVSLHDRLDLAAVPDRVETAAWIRNWTDRWAGRPWFSAYDAVFASSQPSLERIEDRTGRRGLLMPLATNPDRFKPGPVHPHLESQAMFPGNYWGGERMVAEVLPRIAPAYDVKVFGSGWDQVPALAPLAAGALDYEELPAAYSSTGLVVDDSASHARPFGAVNSRVFDALACATPVASNDAAGVHAIFGNDFPVWNDASSLEDLIRETTEDASRLRALAADYREVVLSHHTYAHRAGQLVEALALA